MEEYIREGILEPTLGRDVLVLHAVDKPALMRQLFWYLSRLPSQTVSYEKILGHLQGKGNSATLVHYAELLSLAFIVQPLSKFSPRRHRVKRSIPKWIIPNPALVDIALKKEGASGFIFENLVGSHLLNISFGQKRYELHYWREEDWEIDFMLVDNGQPMIGIEVKSGRIKRVPQGDALKKRSVDCPIKIISQKNIASFLRTTTVEEMLQV